MINMINLNICMFFMITQVTTHSQDHYHWFTVKNFDNKNNIFIVASFDDFITDFNQIHEFTAYHFLVNHINQTYQKELQIKALLNVFIIKQWKFEHINLDNLHIDSNCIHINETDQLFILNFEDLHIYIIEVNHVNQIHNHADEHNIFYQFDQQYWWFFMLKNVKQFVHNCNNCQWFKIF